MKLDYKRQLYRLAELNGVQLSFVDAGGRRQNVAPEVVAGLLKALEVPAGNAGEIRESLRTSRLRPYRQGIEPVAVVWEPNAGKVIFHLPARQARQRVLPTLRFENSLRAETILNARSLGAREVEGERFVSWEILLPPMPPGYHTLDVIAGEAKYRTLIISAPLHSYVEPGAPKSWGVFLPMYAAHSKDSWGAGNFSDWERLSRWIGSQGGTVAATLPLLAAFLDYPVCEPSPYSPASRLYWNEFYLDITWVPEFAGCREARALVASEAFQKEIRSFQEQEMIDYSAQWAARRKVLELLAKHFFSKKSPRRAEFESFLRGHSELKDYASFRAVCDKRKTSWHNWPERLRSGNIRAGDYEESVKRFHLYVQWLAHGQINNLIRNGEQNGVKLYLDLPLGVNPDGYDVWRERDSFAMGASAGAPPDLFFSRGQDWGFAPLHPRRLRESGYRYLLAFLRFQMRHTGLLRIDHVMGLHRLYWVPRGCDATQGGYVRYPADELHAIFNLESHRNRTVLVGENLGTVPPEVNQSMQRHRLHEMFVVQFEGRTEAPVLRAPPALVVASLNTHDTPTFAGYWRGDDIKDCIQLGLLPRTGLVAAQSERKKLKAALVQLLKDEGHLNNRYRHTREVLRALLAWLGTSKSDLVLVNLEDLWLERRPQNVPGTSLERPNWRRKARLTLDQIFHDPNVRRLIRF